MITQLNPTIPMLTPKGEGYALLVIDYSQEHHLLWVVALDDTGEIWAFPNTQVRLCKNPSMERFNVSRIDAQHFMPGNGEKFTPQNGAERLARNGS
jgi:hypothetical protein